MTAKTPPRRHPEYDLQCACMRWLALQYPNVVVVHAPNQLVRSARQGAQLKRMGIRPGVPDLFIAVPRGQYGGLFVELKSPHGRPSADQIETMYRLQRAGYHVVTVASLERFIETVRSYLDS